MMTTVQIEVRGERPPPTGNPFELYACKKHDEWTNIEWHQGIVEIRCGLKLWLPEGMTLEVESSADGLYVLGCRIEDGEIFLMTMRQGASYNELLKGETVLATVKIVEKEAAKVRFIQKDKKGRRIVTGDARPIENSDTETDSQPGE